MEEIVKRIKIAYKGYRRTYNNKREYMYYSPEEDVVLYFNSKLKCDPQFEGCWIEVTRTENGVKSPYVLLHKEEPHPERGAWRAMSREAGLEIDANNLAKRTAEKGFDDVVEGVRNLTKGMNRRQTNAFIFALMSEL